LRCRARTGNPDRQRDFIFRPVRCLGSFGGRPQAPAKGLKTRGKRGARVAPIGSPPAPQSSRLLLMPLTAQTLFGRILPRPPFRLRVPSHPMAGTAWGLSHLPLNFVRGDTCGLVRGSPGAGRRSGPFVRKPKAGNAVWSASSMPLLFFKGSGGGETGSCFFRPLKPLTPSCSKDPERKSKKRRLKEKVFVPRRASETSG